MNIAPLQLKYYFITELYIKARTNYDPKRGFDYKIEYLQCDTKFMKKEDNPLLRQVQFTINCNPPVDANIPYEFKITVVGFFHIDKTWPLSRREELVHFNGLAILYSTAREIIATATSRGPWPQIILPSVNFLPKK
jgi:preprotein translocase subunit SecB